MNVNGQASFGQQFVITQDLLSDKDALASALQGLYAESGAVWQRCIGDIRTCMDYFNGHPWSSQYSNYIKKTNASDVHVGMIRRVIIQQAGDVDKTFKRPYFDFPSTLEDPEDEDQSETAVVKKAYLSMMSQSLRWVNSCLTYYFESSSAKRTLVDANRLAGYLKYCVVKINFDGGGFETENYDFFCTMIDPNVIKRSMNDCTYVVLMKSKTRSELLAKYPDSSKEILSAGAGVDAKGTCSVPQPVYTDTVGYREYWLRDAENIKNPIAGNIVVVKTLASSGKILSIEKPPFSVFPFVLVSPIINPSAPTIGDKFPTYVGDFIGLQEALNKITLFMTQSITNVANSIVLVKSSALLDQDALQRGFNAGYLQLETVESIKDVVSRLEPNTAAQALMAPAKEILDYLMTSSGFKNPTLGNNGSTNETAALIERKEIEEDEATYYYKQALQESTEHLVKKLSIMMIQCAVYGSELARKRTNRKPNMFDIDTALDDIANKTFTIDDLSRACGHPLTANDLSVMLLVIIKSSVLFTYGTDSPIDKDRRYYRLSDLASKGVKIPVELMTRAASTGADEQIIKHNKSSEGEAEMDVNYARSQKDMASANKLNAETQEIEQRVGATSVMESQPEENDMLIGQEDVQNEPNLSGSQMEEFSPYNVNPSGDTNNREAIRNQFTDTPI